MKPANHMSCIPVLSNTWVTAVTQGWIHPCIFFLVLAPKKNSPSMFCDVHRERAIADMIYIAKLLKKNCFLFRKHKSLGFFTHSCNVKKTPGRYRLWPCSLMITYTISLCGRHYFVFFSHDILLIPVLPTAELINNLYQMLRMKIVLRLTYKHYTWRFFSTIS